jgi:hypothetical protein
VNLKPAHIPFAVFSFFILSCLLQASSPVYTHHLADPDDYMRLNEVVAWLRGQDWYDLSVPRLSPNAHTVVHWSRLIDMPIALLAQAFIPTLGIIKGVMAAAMIVPFLWFGVLMGLLPKLAAPIIGHTRATATCVLVLFAPMLLFNYTPGRVDHHGIQAIIAGFGLFCLSQIVLGQRARLCAALAAFGFACGFWIGAEALPWAMLFIACLGIAASWQGRETAREAAIFGLCLPLFTTAMIPAALPATEFSSRALSWFSPAYAIFAVLAGGIFVFGWLMTTRVDNRYLRSAIYAALGLIAAAAFFGIIPSAWRGPFADYDAFDATTALDNITEAQPLAHSLRLDWFRPLTVIPLMALFARVLVLPLLALGTCVFGLRHTRGAKRLVWLAHCVFLAAATAMTVFWQNRVGVFMEIFMLAPLTSLLCVWWDRLRQRSGHTVYYWLEIAAFLLLAPGVVFGVPRLSHALFHAPTSPLTAACDANLDGVISAVNNEATFGASKHTLMNVSDTGPELLLLTNHSVVSGNFDVPGNADAYKFFHAFDDAEAQAAAHRWNADLVLLCRHAPQIYLGKDYYALTHVSLQLAKDGMLHLTNTDPQQPLIARLNRDEIPVWLKPIEIPAPSDYVLFQIQDSVGSK